MITEDQWVLNRDLERDHGTVLEVQGWRRQFLPPGELTECAVRVSKSEDQVFKIDQLPPPQLRQNNGFSSTTQTRTRI